MTAGDRTPTTTSGSPAADDYEPVPHYQIRVKGHLAPRWSTWFDGLIVETDADGTTVISGPVLDQAALHGLLQKLRDVGITLLSLTQLTPNSRKPDSSPTPLGELK